MITTFINVRHEDLSQISIPTCPGVSRVAFHVLLLLVLAWLLPTHASAYSGHTVIGLKATEPMSIIGSPVRVFATVQNRSSEPVLLGPMYRGFLSSFRLEVLGPTGQPASMVRQKIECGPRGGIDSKHLYVLKPQESVQLCYDLAEFIDFSKPGIYKVRAIQDNETVAQISLTLIAFYDEQKLELTAHCALPPSLTSELLIDVDATVVCGKSSTGQQLVSAIIKGTGEVAANAPRHYVEVPLRTKIVRAELDYCWQVWLLLRTNDRMSLLQWDLLANKSQYAIPWDTYQIEMGITAIDLNPKQKIIVAGIAGKTKTALLGSHFPFAQEQP